MTHIPRIACANCGRDMRCEKNGVRLEALTGGSDKPYYKVEADIHACWTCNSRVYAGFASQPTARAFESDYAEHEVDAQLRLGQPQEGMAP